MAFVISSKAWMFLSFFREGETYCPGVMEGELSSSESLDD
jgi:hypothetical protein